MIKKRALQTKLDTIEKMEPMEKKDAEISGVIAPPPPAAAAGGATPTDAESEVEDYERQARELKAGLHPLKVFFFFFFFLFFL